MNYDQARQIEATGKWNWTTMNDGAIRTAPPCFYPDMDWTGMVDIAEITSADLDLVGRPRCDHDTREAAERHYWESERDGIREEHLNLDALRERRRCDSPGCSEWETWRMHWPGGYVVDSFCDRHRFDSAVVHPFMPGMQVIHS